MTLRPHAAAHPLAAWPEPGAMRPLLLPSVPVRRELLEPRCQLLRRVSV